MSNLQRPLAWLLSILLTLTPLMTAQAAMVGTDTLLESAQTRDSLSDSELARINQGIEHLNAGGDVLGILLVIFIVFVITDVIGATDIFPFIHPVN
jgi:hypothetical protein